MMDSLTRWSAKYITTSLKPHKILHSNMINSQCTKKRMEVYKLIYLTIKILTK